MKNWGEIKKQGKTRFIFLYGLVISLPLLMDYYIVKFFLNSFRLAFTIKECLIVWIVCPLLSIFLGYMLGIG
jgi:uncharacterized membrane protein